MVNEALGNRLATRIRRPMGNSKRRGSGKIHRRKKKVPAVGISRSRPWLSKTRAPFLRLVREILLPHVTCPRVLLIDGDYKCFDPVSDGTFRIRFNSAPPGAIFTDGRDSFFGVRSLKSRGMRREWFVFGPTQDGKQIVDEEGACAAQLIGNNLYILFALHHSTNAQENPFYIFRRILEETVKQLRASRNS